MADGIPEQVYLDAARAAALEMLPDGWDTDDFLLFPWCRAAVESAYRAGQAAGADEVEPLPSFGRLSGRGRMKRAAAKSPPDTSWLQTPEVHQGDRRRAQGRAPEKGVQVMSTQMADGIDPPSASMNPAAVPDGLHTWQLPDGAEATARIVVVVDWVRQRVYDMTADNAEAQRWCRELLDRYNDNLAASQCVGLVKVGPGSLFLDGLPDAAPEVGLASDLRATANSGHRQCRRR